MALNRRLSTLDAGFLYGERPEQPTHVGGCMSNDGHVSAGELHLLPRYRQKVVFPPLGIAHPTWEDDPDFDLGDHIEEPVVPDPSDAQTLSAFAGELYAPMLDRDHPLWKLIVLQGLPGGNSAILWKVLHAMVDGVSSVELTMTLHEFTPDAPPPAPPPGQWQPQPMPDVWYFGDCLNESYAELQAAAERAAGSRSNAKPRENAGVR